jgi:hypothetical protein
MCLVTRGGDSERLATFTAAEQTQLPNQMVLCMYLFVSSLTSTNKRCTGKLGAEWA